MYILLTIIVYLVIENYGPETGLVQMDQRHVEPMQACLTPGKRLSTWSPSTRGPVWSVTWGCSSVG